MGPAMAAEEFDGQEPQAFSLDVEGERSALAATPVPLTPLVGRQPAAAAIVDLLRGDDVRLVTLIGPGGVGKTRLALHVLIERDLVAAFADGTIFVSLASVTDPALVLPSIAQAIALRDSGDRSLPDRLRDVLRDRHLLLVLDNVEQVVGAAPEIASLLADCPSLRVLATGRVPLRISGEHEFPVPPLALPDLAHLPPVKDLAVTEAVDLFVQRARAVKPDFALTSANAAAVAGICARLDGLPLAIELAAARVKVLSPSALLARLTNRLQVLTGGARDLPDRLRTMRGAIAWSHDLLSPEEQTLFRHLAAFVGGCTLEAAEAVCGGANDATGDDSCPPLPDILDGLTSLVDKSLLRQEDGPGGEPRFRMLETIQEYGLERLAASGEEASVRRRHAAWCLTLAEQAEPGLVGPDQDGWMDRLETEHDNFRAALGWAMETGDAETGLRLTGALWWFWQIRGYLGEGRAWLNRTITGGRRVSGGAGIRSTFGVRALAGASLLAGLQQDDEDATALAEEALAVAREIDDREGIARALFMRSFAAGGQGNHTAASADAAAALNLFRELGDTHWIAFSLNRLGIETYEQGDLAAAAARYEEALDHWRRRGHSWGIATALTNLGLVARAHGDGRLAAERYQEALVLCWRQRDQWGLVELLVALADIAASQERSDQADLAARLLGVADAVREQAGLILQAYMRTNADRAEANLRARLGNDEYQTAWNTGRETPLSEVIAAASAVASGPLGGNPTGTAAVRQGPMTPAEAIGLTPRERDVLRLLVEGRSSRDIAAELFISHRTVTTHVANIFAKLGVDSRAAAVAYAFQHHLLEDQPSRS